MMTLVELFCDVDDFCKAFIPLWRQQQISTGEKKRCKPSSLSESEIMTIMIYFHQSSYRNFKHFYCDHVVRFLKLDFPRLVSYSRFVELMQSVLVPLTVYLNSRKGEQTGIAFVDSAKLAVCHNLRIGRHRVFADIAARGKTSTGWFYGFKLHIVINERGELLGFCVTPGNVNDRTPVPSLTKKLTGKLFGDKGYLSQALFEELLAHGLQLITSIRTNMKNKLMPLMDKLLLRKRFIIETVLDQLKNISQIEHSRHRSIKNFMVNLIAGLVAYTHQAKKPSLNLAPNQMRLVKMLA